MTKCALTLQAPEPAMGLFDPSQMEQLMINLLNYAMKFGPGKPIEVSVLNLPDGGIRLAVHDHGIGIRQDRLGKLFKRFERAGVSEKISGFGLGLYIVRQIVDGHRGTI